MVTVSTDHVGSGVIKRELVLISVAVTTCVSDSKIVVTTWELILGITYQDFNRLVSTYLQIWHLSIVTV